MLAAACSSSNSGSTLDRGGQVGPSAGTGYCQDTCSKDCTRDEDCEMSKGEMCCSLGAAGNTCLDATICPKACTEDSKCNMTVGQICGRPTLSDPQQFCMAPEASLRTTPFKVTAGLNTLV
jgi:hypothetical protein